MIWRLLSENSRGHDYLSETLDACNDRGEMGSNLKKKEEEIELKKKKIVGTAAS
jgi:hypothetical protein